MTILIILFFIFSDAAFTQCRQNQIIKGSSDIRGINNGIDHYYQNLIIQDIAIAGQVTFQEISLQIEYEINFTTDLCRPGQLEITVLPVKVQCHSLLYQGYDISTSVKPESAELVFHILQPGGLVTDSLTFTVISVDVTSKLYTSLTFQNNNIASPVEAEFARLQFHYSKASYEKFRDHLLKIDDYYAACMLADSAILWSQSGFLSESEIYPEMIMRQVELEHILEYIRPARFDSVFIYGQRDLNGLQSKYVLLCGLNKRYKAIIAYNHLTTGRFSDFYLKNELLKNYLDQYDHYYHLAYSTDFRYVNFLNDLATAGFSNRSILELYRSVSRHKRWPRHVVREWARLLADALIERGNENVIAGNQPRALTWYNAAAEFSKLIHLNDYQIIATNLSLRTNDAVAASYIDISKKGAERENPSIAAQYYRDACGMFIHKDYINESPVWLIDYEQWLFSNFEEQAVRNIEQKNFTKALAYLDEIQSNCMFSATYPCPGSFHEWMGAAREGVYLQLLNRAGILAEKEDFDEAEKLYRQAVDMRMKAGYRIDKNLAEAKLETRFNQMNYEEVYDEGLRNYEKSEFVPALYYFNKAVYLEKSGVSQPEPKLILYRQDAARQVILNTLSDGRLKAWANDFENAGSILDQVHGMLVEYQFAKNDTLALLYADLEENIKRTECANIFDQYDDLMVKVEKSEKEKDYILAQRFADEAVTLSMDNLKCRIDDQQAWYQKIKLGPLADFQQKEHKLDLLIYKSVPEYLSAYQDLKSFYYRNKLLEQGVIFASLTERVMMQKDSAFLTGMLEHFIDQDDYKNALLALQRLHDLQYKPGPLKDQQQSLAEKLARRDAMKTSEVEPWDILDSYTAHDKWYRSFNRSYKMTWLKISGWKLKFWPIIWRK